MFDPNSAVNHFKNPDSVEWIKQTKKIVELETNAGSKLNNAMAFTEACGGVWFDEDALANAMALKNV